MSEKEKIDVLRMCYRWVYTCAENIDMLYASGLGESALLFEQYIERWLELAEAAHQGGVSYDEMVEMVRVTVEGRPSLPPDASWVVGESRRVDGKYRRARSA